MGKTPRRVANRNGSWADRSRLLVDAPQPNRDHAVVFEAMSLGNDLRAEEFIDSHGNAV
eukprot:gene51287-69806_t